MIEPQWHPTAPNPLASPFHPRDPAVSGQQQTLHKGDFVLIPYLKSSNLRATYQIVNTLVPYGLLWFAAVKVAPISPWLLPPILVLLILFAVRCFALMHDCGHHSLFRSKRMNRVMGFVLGVINAMPSYGWSRDHAYHHKTNGDWERYRGVADFLSTTEFAQLDPVQQRWYQVLRHPWMAIPGGFFYLVIKPRLIFILGIYDLICDLIQHLKSGVPIHLGSVFSEHKSKYWHSLPEFWDLLLNTLFVVGGWIFLSQLWGVALFWSIYGITLSCSATIFIWVFFVQHIFEDSYAHKTDGWDYILGAVKGSSYLKLPTLLNWFTADIGYHPIHHLSERIPNYLLAACYQKNSHLLAEVKSLHMGSLFDCAQFVLWDADANRLVSIAQWRHSINSSCNPSCGS